MTGQGVEGFPRTDVYADLPSWAWIALGLLVAGAWIALVVRFVLWLGEDDD